MNQTHEKITPVIAWAARQFQKRYGGNLDDLKQSAWVIFLESEPRYDPARAQIQTFACAAIWRGLRRKFLQEQKQLQRELSHRPPAPAFDVSRFRQEISEEAATIVELLFESAAVRRRAVRRGKSFFNKICRAAGVTEFRAARLAAEIEAALV